MIRLITESDDFNKIIYNVNMIMLNEKSVCDFLLNEFNLLCETKIQKKEDYIYYDDMFNIIYKSIYKENTVISYITLSYAIIFIMIFIQFSSDAKICVTKDKGSDYIFHKNNIFIYPDCSLGIKIVNNDKYLLIDYRGNIKLNEKNDFNYGKFLTQRDFKVFKFDQSKFQYVSNIHLEQYELFNLSEVIKNILIPNSPYLIIAGNLTTYGCISRLDLFFDYYSLFYDKIIYILGDYEYYGSNLSLEKTPAFYKEYIRRYNWRKSNNKKIILLDKELLVFNNIHIIGLTLWSNLINIEMQDYIDYFKHIKNITYEDVSNTHIKSVLWLNNTLKEINENLPVLVISYHIPSYNLIDERKIENLLRSGMQQAFASNLDAIIRNHNNIINWIIGHPVALENDIINGTLFLSKKIEKKEDVDYIVI